MIQNRALAILREQEGQERRCSRECQVSLKLGFLLEGWRPGG